MPLSSNGSIYLRIEYAHFYLDSIYVGPTGALLILVCSIVDLAMTLWLGERVCVK